MAARGQSGGGLLAPLASPAFAMVWAATIVSNVGMARVGRIQEVAARPARRDTLPGCEAKGTEVPKRVLVAALKTAIAVKQREGRVRLLRRLLEIAEGERTLPRANSTAHYGLLLDQAGAANLITRADTAEIFNDWLAFFHLDERNSTRMPDGTVRRERIASLEVQEHIDQLREADLTPLLSSAQYPDTPSYTALERELNIGKSMANDPASRQIIMAYWREAGPGPVYEGRTGIEKRIRDRRRDELIAFAKERVDANLPLPGTPGRRPMCDFDGLVRMRGTPGPNMADDDRFKKRLRDMKPTYVRLEAIEAGEIATYAQLAAAYEKFRLAGVGKGSRSATRNKVNAAIDTFRAHFGRTPSTRSGTTSTPLTSSGRSRRSSRRARGAHICNGVGRASSDTCRRPPPPPGSGLS